MNKLSFIFLLTLFITVSITAQEKYDTSEDEKNYSRMGLNQNLQRDWSQFPLNSSSINSGIWTEVHPLIPRVTYWGVHFVSADTGWAVGEGGAIIKTTNGGEKWIWYESGVEITLKTVSSVNGQRVIAAGDGGIILISEDGGESWASIPSGTTNNIWNMQMITEQIGWMVGESSTALKTTDGGLTWLQQSVPHTNLAYWDVSFVDTSFGYICCNTAIVLKTTNGGGNWQIQQAGDTRSLFTIYAFDTLRASAGGFAGKVVYSSDGGTNWISLPNVGAAEVNKIKFINDTTGFMAGEGIYQSTDGGMSWFYRDDLTVSGFSTLTTNLSFPTGIEGHITGGEMLLAKTTDKGESWRRTMVNDDFLNVYFKDEQRGFINSSQLIYKTNDGGYTIDTLDTFPYNALDEFNGMTFIDSMTGFIGYGTIYKTTDGGNSWYATNGAGGGVRKFSFISPTIGWAVGGSTIYKTVDAGENWQLQLDVGFSATFQSIYFIDSLVGWTANTNDRPYKTTDGGENWIKQTNVILFNNWDIYFIDSLKGFSTESSELYVTSDGGVNWTIDGNVLDFGRGRFSYLDSNYIFITGDKVYRTTDAGINWKEEVTIDGFGTSMQLLSPNSGHLISNIGLLVKYDNIIPVELINFEGIISNNKTTLTWTTITESNNNGFVVQRRYSNSDSWEDLDFVEGRGNSTNIIHYSYIDFINEFGIYFYRLKQVDYDGTYTWSNEIEIAFLKPLKFEVYQNFPNPFNPRTIVRVLLPEPSYIKVNVYNLLGELVNKIVDRYYEAGIVDISIDANGIPSGIYLYQVVSRSANGQVNSKTKKMLIIK